MEPTLHGKNESPSVAKLIEEFVRADATGPAGAKKWRWFHPFDTSWQKWTFWGLAGTFLAAVLALLPAIWLKSLWVRLLPAVLLLMSALFAFAYQLAIMLPDFLGFLSSPVGTFVAPCLSRAERGRARVGQLSLCDPWELEFLEQHLKLDAEHLRARWSYMVGPVEKVGALPAVAAALGTFLTLRSALLSPTAESWLQVGAFVLMALYIGALCGLFVVHRVEHHCLLLSTARKLSEKHQGSATR